MRDRRARGGTPSPLWGATVSTYLSTWKRRERDAENERRFRERLEADEGGGR
jgi:hypothetical protein